VQCKEQTSVAKTNEKKKTEREREKDGQKHSHMINASNESERKKRGKTS